MGIYYHTMLSLRSLPPLPRCKVVSIERTDTCSGRAQRGGGATKTVEQKVTEEAIVGRQKRRNVRGMFVKGMERFF